MEKEKKQIIGLTVQMFCGQEHGNCFFCEKKEGEFIPIVLDLGYGFVVGTDTRHIFCSLDCTFKYINSWKKQIKEDFEMMKNSNNELKKQLNEVKPNSSPH